MKLHRPVALALLASVGLAASAPFEQVSFHPEADAERAKSFTVVADMQLDDFSAVVDGEDVGDMIGDIELSITAELAAAVRDTYVETSDGRPIQLRRQFGEISQNTIVSFSSAMEASEEEMPNSSELEGKTVIFKWNAEEGEYGVEFDGEGDEELLAGLEEDMDLRILLPGDDIATGDSWEVPLEQLGSLFLPGGNLGLGFDEMDAEETELFDTLFGEDFLSQLRGLFEGECRCTLKAIGEVDGAQVAELGVRIEIASDADVSDMLLDLLETAIDIEDPGIELEFSVDTADLRVGFEADGTLLWDVDAGVVKSFELAGDAELGFDLAISIDAEGMSQSAELSAELSGTIEIGVTSDR